MTLARRLGPIELRDHLDQPVVVADAWAERPALLVFVRHFG